MNKQSESVAAGAADDIQRRLQGGRYRALQYRRKAGNKKDIGLKKQGSYRGVQGAYRRCKNKGELVE